MPVVRQAVVTAKNVRLVRVVLAVVAAAQTMRKESNAVVVHLRHVRRRINN